MTDRDLEAWQRVLADLDLLGEVAATPAPERKSPSFVARMRRSHSAEDLSLAMELCEVRERASEKFEQADRLFADRSALEQASGLNIARYKARRFARALADRELDVFDVCCGAGGDLFALREACGARVRGVDRDPVRVAMAQHNSGAEVLCESLESLLERDGISSDALVHCDPARRSDAGRLWRLDDLIPGPESLAALIARARGAAIKLGPGTDVDELRGLGERDAEGFEYEWIAEGRSLRQLVLWSGVLAGAERGRRATRIAGSSAGESASGRFSIVGDAEPAAVETFVGAPDRFGFLIELDPVVERAGLGAVAFGAASALEHVSELHPGLGLYGSDRKFTADTFRCFEIVADLPWRQSKVRRQLRDHGFGAVAVKTRGGVIDANAIERSFGSVEGRPGVLFVLRLGTQVRAIVCETPAQD